MAARKRRAQAPTKKKAAARKKAATGGGFPKRIYAIASPRSVGGVSMFEADSMITSETVGNFDSDPDLVARAVDMLSEAGFDILAANTAMINIAGSKTTFERAFSTQLLSEERNVIKPGGIEDTATFIDTADTETSGLVDTGGTRFGELLEGVAIEEPYYPMAGSIPPRVDSWYLDVPDGVDVALNAARVHRSGRTGRGVTVAMVDTGWYRHPFFTDRGYRADQAILGPGAVNADDDESGHGTGESANIFAAAPDVHLKPVKAANASGALVNVTAAFNAAVALGPDIITNSWGADVPNGPLSAARQAQAAAIAAAVASGIVVCFSAGNGHWGFPGQHPDVISVGGVYRDEAGSLQASDYASGFVSNIYPGRQVPDVCGMVGMRPGAEYIMLPVQDGDQIDVSKSSTDGTANNDGWALFSGTSAACPQIAGVVALMKEACSKLTPIQIRDILKSTAIDITAGSSHPNTPGTTGPGPDTATGSGLVDAAKAVAVARLRCLVFPIFPLLPLFPLQPVQPLIPVFPLQPTTPLLPLKPLVPLIPIRPFLPLLPGPRGGIPVEGQAAYGSREEEAQMRAYGESQAQLTPDEAEYLEQLVMEGGDDLLDEM
jgi:subtilisin family serine protease